MRIYSNTCKYKTQWRFPICIAIHVAVSCPLKITFAANVEHDRRDDRLDVVEEIKDLGVIYDSLLLFDKHISEKVNKAYMMLGIIKRNFEHITRNCFVTSYKSLVRSHLEYANSVWYPQRKMDVDKLERVQKRATNLIPELSKKSYSDRLKALKLPTLKCRRY